MKMCRVVLANILNVPKIRNIIEMGKFCRIFEAACEISDAPAVIKSNKEAVSMCCNISSERHFTKRLLFFLAAKITSSSGFKKMSSISPRWLVKSAISSALRISITLPTLRHRRGENRLGKFERDLTLLKWMVGFNLALTVAIVIRLPLGAVIDAIFYGGLIAMACAAIWATWTLTQR